MRYRLWRTWLDPYKNVPLWNVESNFTCSFMYFFFYKWLAFNGRLTLTGDFYDTCFKTDTILPCTSEVSTMSCLNNHHTVAHKSILRNWFSNTSKITSLPAWTLASPVCIQNQRIYRGCHIHCPPLSLHTIIKTITIKTSISAFNTILSRWLENFTLWAWVQHPAIGYWTDSKTDPRLLGLAVTPALL